MNTYEEYIKKEGWSNEFQAKMLLRMISDCDYYCGYGQMGGKRLWATVIDEQIGLMLAIVKNIGEDIISSNEILSYKSKMIDTDKRVKTAKELSVHDMISHLPAGFYAYIPDWAKDHPEIETDYPIVVPYMQTTRDAAYPGGQAMHPILVPFFDNKENPAFYSIEEIRDRISQKVAVFERAQILSYPYPEHLQERVNQAIKNGFVFLDLENDMWYVRLEEDQLDPESPIQMKDGYYTHLFGQFRFYPNPGIHLSRKEEFERGVDTLMDELFDVVCKEIDDVKFEEGRDGELYPYSFKNRYFFWTLLNKHKSFLESFIESPEEDSLLTILNDAEIIRSANMMGHKGELRLTIKRDGGSHILGKFLFRTEGNDEESITCYPFEIRRAEDDQIKLYLSEQITRKVLANSESNKNVLVSFLAQQPWSIKGDTAQSLFRKACAPIWIEQTLYELTQQPVSLTTRMFPTEKGTEEFYCLVCRKHQMEELFTI